MKSYVFKDLLVSIPHAGLLCPCEIPIGSLSEYQQELANNVDWHTDRLYDFQDLLENRQVLFPYSQVYVNVNRHPNHLDESAPLSIDGIPVYKPNLQPSVEQRKFLIKKYHASYHRLLSKQKKSFILDAHSTVPGHEDASGNRVSDDIILSDWQKSHLDLPEGIRTAPEGYLEAYAEELELRLSGFNIRVAKNTTYCSTYGHIMATHGWDGKSIKDNKAPLLLQETSEVLYIKNGIPDVKAIEELRRIFAESLGAMITRINCK